MITIKEIIEKNPHMERCCVIDDNEIDLFDDDDIKDFMHTWRQVVKRWNR